MILHSHNYLTLHLSRYVAPNINDGLRIISPLVHQLDIRRAIDYDGIPGVVGAGLGWAAHILLGYTPTYTGGISL